MVDMTLCFLSLLLYLIVLVSLFALPFFNVLSSDFNESVIKSTEFKILTVGFRNRVILEVISVNRVPSFI